MAEDKMRKISLSKSRLMRGLQCAKSLYLTIHNPELEPPVLASQQALFDQGHEVGAKAQQEIPGGVFVKSAYYDTEGAVKETEREIKGGANTVYEATFAKDGLSAKIDILHRESNNGAWQVIEVKSSTSVKPEHLDDVAVQVHILQEAGQRIDVASVMHLNNQSTAPKLENLFTRAAVTVEIKEKTAALPETIARLRTILSSQEPPKIDIGPHCHEPYECPFVHHCWGHVPSPSIFDFPGLGSKVWDLYGQGIVKMNDPKFGPFTGAKAQRLTAIRSGNRWTDLEAITEAMSEWKWPLIFLDFETINFAIPRYDGTRPYEQVPFQFSCMIQSHRQGPVEHIEFLHDKPSDPRPALISALVPVLEKGVSIVAYNKGFEATRLKGMAGGYPEHSKILLQACERLVDPLPIFRNSVYDPQFKDSFSIKSVAPAILGADGSYDGLPVPDGSAAQRAFVELIDLKTSHTRANELRNAMLAYCKKDTDVMVRLVDWLVTIGQKNAAA